MGKKKTTEPAAVYISPEKLNPWPRNPRHHNVDGIAGSIEKFGFGAPIVARKDDYRVIAGHGRLQAAIQLGMESVPVRLLDISNDQADALAIADNQLLGEWDEELLGAVLGDLKQVDDELLDSLGFSEVELDLLIGKTTQAEFLPTDGGSQPTLDKTKVHVCPECGHEWSN